MRRFVGSLPSSAFCLVLFCLLPTSDTNAQNGITAAQGAAISPLSSGTDYLWADTTDARWKVSNNGGSGLDLATWPCGGAQGGLVYSGSPAVNSVYPEACLSMVGITPGVPLIVGASSLTPSGGGAISNSTNSLSLDLQGWTAVVERPNVSTGTTLFTLAKITYSGSSGVITATTSDASTPTYVVVAGAGTSGNAQLAVAGHAYCTMDSTLSSVAGQPVYTSAATAGDCATAAAPPIGSWVVGEMVDNGTTGGSKSLILVRPGAPWLPSSVSSGTVLGNTATSSGVATFTSTPVLGVASTTTGTLKFFNSGNTGSVMLSPASSTNNATLTLPDPASNDTLVARNTSDTLTNKALISATSGNNVTLVCGAGPQSEINGNGSAQTFISCTIPGNIISTGSIIKAHVVWQHTTGSSAGIVYNWIFNSGTSTTYTCSGTPCTTSATILSDDVNVYETGSSAQQMEAGSANGGNAFVSSSHSLTSQTQATSSNFTIGYQFNVASGDKVTGKMLFVTIIQ